MCDLIHVNILITDHNKFGYIKRSREAARIPIVDRKVFQRYARERCNQKRHRNRWIAGSVTIFLNARQLR